MGNISITVEDNVVGIKPQNVNINLEKELSIYAKQLANCKL